MENIAGRKAGLTWAVHIAVAALVLLWMIPTVGLFVSSFRDRDQIAQSGWWIAPLPVEMTFRTRIAADGQRADGDGHVIETSVFADASLARWFPQGTGRVTRFGTRGAAPTEHEAGAEAGLRGGGTVTIAADGTARLRAPEPLARPVTLYFEARIPPRITTANYGTVLRADGMGRAFLNTLTVAIPATVIPIAIAAFAAYALAWMEFPGRALLIACVVGLLVVPLQLALIPLLRLHLGIGIGKGYLGVWLAHTGFGLPLAIYLLRNYMVGLPRDIIENAKVDGATDFQIFTKIILPLSFPALASFAIFQFLWTWNDLLVAKVFLIDATGQTTVMTNQIVELLGTRGGNWEILATAAFVSIAVPLVVFFAMQKYLVRGLLAGSVK